MRYYVTLANSDREHAIDILTRADGSVDVQLDGTSVPVDAVETNGALSVRVGDRMFDLWLDGDGENVRFVSSGLRMSARVESERSRIGARASRAGSVGGGGQICAPMPGRVVKVLVTEGEAVEVGRPLVVVEAMKMENELCAEAPGIVDAIRATAGQTVESGAVLLELGPLPA
jgi:biotin carboxyl carrier protein